MTRPTRTGSDAASGRRAVAPPLSLSLQQPDGRHRALLTRAFVARCLRPALGAPAEIAVRVVGDEEGRVLDRRWRGQDHPTNVLTFAYASEPTIVADLVLCAPVVEREAASLGIALEAHYAHLLVHGALHAQGLDHGKAAEARLMESRERAILASLGIADPYAAGGR